MKHSILLLASFLFLSAPSSLKAQEITEDILNQFKIELPDGDGGTLYFSADHTFIFIPKFSNHGLVHICNPKWKFIKDTSHLVIEGATECSALNGDYLAKKSGSNIILKDATRTLTLQAL